MPDKDLGLFEFKIVCKHGEEHTGYYRTFQREDGSFYAKDRVYEGPCCGKTCKDNQLIQ